MAEMRNADFFQREFGIYATELWAMPEQQFLAWLNAPCDRERPKNMPSAQPTQLNTPNTLEALDCISRQAAIASAISGRIRTLPTTEDGEDWIRVSEVRESLKAVPSAQKVGKWIYTPTEPLGYICSECRIGCCRFKFCPHCGARMEAE